MSSSSLAQVGKPCCAFDTKDESRELGSQPRLPGEARLCMMRGTLGDAPHIVIGHRGSGLPYRARGGRVLSNKSVLGVAMVTAGAAALHAVERAEFAETVVLVVVDSVIAHELQVHQSMAASGRSILRVVTLTHVPDGSPIHPRCRVDDELHGLAIGDGSEEDVLVQAVPGWSRSLREA